MELVVNQQIYYSNKQIIPIRDIAESLLALEGVIRHSPKVLEALFPGTTIFSVDIFIKELKSDSLWEDFIIKFIFGGQTKFDECIESMRERIGMDNIMNKPQLIGAIIAVLILTGGAYYLGKDQLVAPEERAAIEANNNTIINIGAGMLEMSSEEFKILIEGAVKDKSKLAKDAVRLVQPANKDPEASITFNNNKDLQIRPETIKVMSRHTNEPENTEFIEDFLNIDMELRATDLDSTKRGWAVVVPELSDRRIKLQFDSTVNPEDLYEKRRFKGNISVIFRYDKEYKEIPTLVFLRKVTE
jgi:hypothetical protein